MLVPTLNSKFNGLLKSFTYNKSQNINDSLLHCTHENNIHNLSLILENATKNDINLNLNETSKDGNYPLLYCIQSNNSEMVKLLIDYAISRRITLKIN